MADSHNNSQMVARIAVAFTVICVTSLVAMEGVHSMGDKRTKCFLWKLDPKHFMYRDPKADPKRDPPSILVEACRGKASFWYWEGKRFPDRIPRLAATVVMEDDEPFESVGFLLAFFPNGSEVKDYEYTFIENIKHPAFMEPVFLFYNMQVECRS